uniref:PHD-type domain-containing protein n=1 Tax=Paramoeba aestuarina TaxID=180227 RepID=A0A7S4JTF4_9EUKA
MVCKKCENFWHISCVKTSVKIDEDGTWLCSNCLIVGQVQFFISFFSLLHFSPHPFHSQEENDLCAKCGERGELLCCDTCPRVFHLSCHDPPLSSVPEEEVWQCQYCTEK